MQSIRYILVILILHLFSSANAQNQYVVYNTSKGVILKSTKYGEIINPVRGTDVYEKDTFNLKDERYFVKIKDNISGEIFSYTGKALITPSQIVSSQKYSLFDKFFSFLLTIANDSGFDTAPIRTSQCVTIKGYSDKVHDSLTINIASQINNAISCSDYVDRIDVMKVYSHDHESFYYSVKNNDSVDYAIVLYTVTKSGSVTKHDSLFIKDLGRFRTDKIEFIPLLRYSTLNLNYFLMASDEDSQTTCYVLLFIPNNFYMKLNNGLFDTKVNWDSDSISSKLTYQGNVNRVIYIYKY